MIWRVSARPMVGLNQAVTGERGEVVRRTVRSDTSARLARVSTWAKHTRSGPAPSGRVVGDRHPDGLERGPAPVERDAPRRRDELARAGELVGRPARRDVRRSRRSSACCGSSGSSTSGSGARRRRLRDTDGPVLPVERCCFRVVRDWICGKVVGHGRRLLCACYRRPRRLIPAISGRPRLSRPGASFVTATCTQLYHTPNRRNPFKRFGLIILDSTEDLVGGATPGGEPRARRAAGS